jgi:ABC-type iron transport system FetAB ATPase subunit
MSNVRLVNVHSNKMSTEPAWEYHALYVAIALLLTGAILWEWAATKQLKDRSSQNLARATQEDTNSCDRVGLALNLNEYENDIVTVQWRRGLIASVAILLLLPVVANVNLSSRQSVAVMILVWVVFTNVAGFFDYHTRKVSSNVVDQCLTIALPGISDSSNTGTGSGVCSADIWQAV